MTALTLQNKPLATCATASLALIALLDVLIFHGGWTASINSLSAFCEAWRTIVLGHVELVVWLIAVPTLTSLCHGIRQERLKPAIVGLVGLGLTWFTLWISLSDAGAAGSGGLCALAIPAVLGGISTLASFLHDC